MVNKVGGKILTKAKSIEQVEADRIQEIFDHYDKIEDGCIAVKLVGVCLRNLGYCPTEERLSALIQQYDPNARLSLQEFIPMMRELDKEKQKTPEELIDCLANFDRDGNGLVPSTELRYILTSLGEKLTDEQVDILLLGQENSEGKVNIHDFVRQILS